ncbi:hypothetical protein E2C01_089973 [Portunus trituberculatus]|uniref:Uncharacterized protein n=1 Tax=Portunus trituberculatus TaxID=210409 RepID=A0A5B7JNV6_PORTR|nr:hypothetical protein [Portunus trituberculatus]
MGEEGASRGRELEVMEITSQEKDGAVENIDASCRNKIPQECDERVDGGASKMVILGGKREKEGTEGGK